MRRQIIVSGKDAEIFLQQITTNDIKNAEKLIYSLFLTPNGKLLHDVFILKVNHEAFVLDCFEGALNDVESFLRKYKIGLKVTIEQTEFNLLEYDDPRHESFGKYSYENKFNVHYDLCLPRLYYDFESEKYFPFDVGYEKFNSISYNKGCYIGQEVITRTHFRGVIRKKVYSVKTLSDGKKGAEIFSQEQKVGVLLNSYGAENNFTRYLAVMNSEILKLSEKLTLNNGTVVEVCAEQK
jgi:folate-binding protein YgfZ